MPGVRLDCSGVQLSWSNTLAGVDGQDWFTPFGDPIVQVDCDVCGKRLAGAAETERDREPSRLMRRWAFVPSFGSTARGSPRHFGGSSAVVEPPQ